MRAARRVVLTRTPADNARLREALGALDAEIVDYPCIAIEPVPIRQEIAGKHYDGAFFVSRNAVEQLFAQVAAPSPARVVALGAATAEALHARGWTVAAQPSEARLETAARETERLFPAATRVLYVRGELGSDVLPEALRLRGVEVDVAVVYATRDAVDAPLPDDARPSLIVFASPSAVRHFATRNAWRGEACAIGETTAQAAREAGFAVRVAPASTTDAVAAAVRAWAVSAKKD